MAGSPSSSVAIRSTFGTIRRGRCVPWVIDPAGRAGRVGTELDCHDCDRAGSAAVPDSPILEVYPYLCVRGAAAAIDFYTRVFGASEITRLMEPSGRVAHAELRLGPTLLMLADEFPEHGFLSPLTVGGTGTTIHLHVRDVDALAARAAAAGATVVSPPTDQGHGERQCRLRDPFGHAWLLGHEIPRLADAQG